MADDHREEGQISRAREIQESMERLQDGEAPETQSTRERLEHSAAKFWNEHPKKSSGEIQSDMPDLVQ